MSQYLFKVSSGLKGTLWRSVEQHSSEKLQFQWTRSNIVLDKSLPSEKQVLKGPVVRSCLNSIVAYLQLSGFKGAKWKNFTGVGGRAEPCLHAVVLSLCQIYPFHDVHSDISLSLGVQGCIFCLQQPSCQDRVNIALWPKGPVSLQ